MSKIEINEQFARALKLMEEGEKSLFITGRAGTGKSTLLEHFRKNTLQASVVLASTGVAAVNVRGQTIHSFFGFKPDITIELAKKTALRKIKSKSAGLYQKIENIIINAMVFLVLEIPYIIIITYIEK